MNKSILTLSSVVGLTFAPLTGFAQTRFQQDEVTHTIVRATGLFSGTPLLDGFFFRFGPPLGQQSREDHDFQLILVRPQEPGPAQLTLSFSDEEQDKEYSYITSFHIAQFGGTRTQIERVGCVEECPPRQLQRPSDDHVFVIIGFQLFFLGEDHHLERIAVKENDGTLTVALADEGQKTFVYILDYAYLPPNQVAATGEVTGSGREGDERVIAPGHSVISGFDLRFTNGDHEVREIGIDTPDDGRIRVFYNDRNFDDPFDWMVRWTTLRPDVIRGPTGL